MRVVDSVIAAGEHGLNEDRLGHHDCVSWVIDGATSLETDPYLPAPTDVQWLVDFLSQRLDNLSKAESAMSAMNILCLIADATARELRGHEFPPDRVHPTCSIGIAVDHGDTCELARVGDVTCLAVGRTLTELSTDFFSRREATAVASADGGGLAHGDVRTALLARRDDYIRGIHSESVFSGHPARRIRSYSAQVTWSDADHLLLCTDGFARAVVDYDLYTDWRSLHEAAITEGLSGIATRIREFEGDVLAGRRSTAERHFKAMDDLAAIIVAK